MDGNQTFSTDFWSYWIGTLLIIINHPVSAVCLVGVTGQSLKEMIWFERERSSLSLRKENRSSKYKIWTASLDQGKGLISIWCPQVATEKHFNTFSVCLPTLHSQNLLPLYFQLSTGLRRREQRNSMGASSVGCIAFLCEFVLGRFAWRQTERLVLLLLFFF